MTNTFSRNFSRRDMAKLLAAGTILPSAARAGSYTEIKWEDLIPPGVPYSEIIAEGDMDEQNDTWRPVFDANATKLNTALDGARVKMPGYVVPLDYSAEGLREFIFAPYSGACIHVPPPPANQLVYVTSKQPFSPDELYYAIWLYGTLRAELKSTELAEIGYRMDADKYEIYQW